MQPAEPAGRAPARRRAGAIAAFTGIVVLLHAALLSEVRWMWPTPPTPFGALEVRALAAPSAPDLVIVAKPTRGLDAGAGIESTAATAARAGEGQGMAVLRLADAHPAAQAARPSAATKPAVARPTRERAPGSRPTAAEVVAEAAPADRSNRDRRRDVDNRGGRTMASGVAVSAPAAVAAESVAAIQSIAAADRVNAAESGVAEALPPDPASLSGAPAQATAVAWPEPESIPLYRTRPPPAMTLRFALRVGAADGTAELRWRPEADSYGLRFEGRVENGPTLTQASDGGFDGAGLAPVRHTDARTRRGMFATNFQREAGRISFSGSRAQLALARGSQDRLSWMVQLAAVLAAEPALRRPGAIVSIPVAGLRGEAAVWRFRTVEPETPVEAQAMQPRVHLVRDRQGPYDVDIAVALDPAHHFLPVTLSLRTANGLPSLELVLREAVVDP